MAIGKLFHIIHMTGDLPELEAWYDDVFSVQRGFLDHHYMEGEKRDASLVVLGDCVIEPLVPRFRRLLTGLVRASVFGLHLDNYRIIQFCTEDLYGTAGHQLRNAVRRR